MKKKTILKTVAGLGAALALGLGVAVYTHLIPSPLDLMMGPRQKDMVVDKAQRDQLIDSLIGELNQRYVFPEKTRQIETLLRSKQQGGAYDAITSAEIFAETLTADIKRDTKDGHLGVEYSEEIVHEAMNDDSKSDAISDEVRARAIRLNSGLEAVQRFPYNIGYVDLHMFAPPALADAKFAAAMTLLADTRALIIDLRKNHGGEPEAVALFASYLFDGRTHLNDIYFRDENRTQEFWTSEQVAGPRYGSQRKIYLLTSQETFSAGEDFAYAMKNLKRATLIGETTGGGAHPGGPRRLNAHFAVFIPTGRSISPITHTDWEGVGVIPDIASNADKALNLAQSLILKERLASETDPREQAELQHRLSELN